MPSIKTNPEQTRALNEVTEKLDLLAEISKLDAGEIGSVTIVISKEGQPRKGTKITLPAGDKEAQKVLSAIIDYRKRLAKEVKEKGKRFDLDFSEEELALLNGKTMAPAVEESDPMPDLIPQDEAGAQPPEQDHFEDDDEAYLDARRRFESEI